MPGDHCLKKEPFKFAGRSPPKKRTFQICREITAQKTRTVLFVLQQEKGIPDNRETSEPIAVLFVLQTQEKGIPDNRVTWDPLAVLCVLQTQDKGIPDNREMSEEEEKGVEERREGAQPREKTYNLQQTLGENVENCETLM